MSKTLELSGSDDEAEAAVKSKEFKINQNYAERYNNWREKEEYQKRTS